MVSIRKHAARLVLVWWTGSGYVHTVLILNSCTVSYLQIPMSCVNTKRKHKKPRKRVTR